MMCLVTPSTTLGLSKPISRRLFLRQSLVAGVGLLAGVKDATANPTNPDIDLKWNLKKVASATYLSVQTNGWVDRIEWHHSFSNQMDDMRWSVTTQNPKKTEFLLGDLRGSIELRAYRSETLLRREMVRIG